MFYCVALFSLEVWRHHRVKPHKVHLISMVMALPLLMQCDSNTLAFESISIGNWQWSATLKWPLKLKFSSNRVSTSVGATEYSFTQYFCLFWETIAIAMRYYISYSTWSCLRLSYSELLNHVLTSRTGRRRFLHKIGLVYFIESLSSSELTITPDKTTYIDELSWTSLA